MDVVNGLFSNANPLLGAVRELGMGLVDRIGPLRRGFMREAAGLALAPMPALLEGRRP
jgi:2-octaprenyl-6-methoxyphenol hydroxylase